MENSIIAGEEQVKINKIVLAHIEKRIKEEENKLA